MAITAGICNSFKQEVLGATHDLDTDTIKIALYADTSGLSPSTTVYTTTGEITGTGYDAGGQALTGATISLDSGVGIVTFDDASWTSATIAAAGALIYNSSKSNKAIAVLDFGSTKSSNDGDFKIIMPTFDSLNALIRLS
jgi:hypothetical protein